MSKKPDSKKQATVHFRIMLDVGMNFGAMTLEDALAKAKTMDVTDVVDLTDLDYNDGSIEVSGLFN